MVRRKEMEKIHTPSPRLDATLRESAYSILYRDPVQLYRSLLWR